MAIADNPFSSKGNMQNTNLERSASVQHRLGGFALDMGLYAASIITLFLGYIIWSLVVWAQGLTPGKQILKMRVYSVDTGKPATWGHMAIRQFLIPMAFSAVFIPFFIVAIAAGYDYSGYWGSSLSLIFVMLGYIALFGLSLTDAFWILRGNKKQRLTDLWARTYVVNEAQQ
jgi:uncharacterized RDD family membrane protein YckC